jgi:hypothetical protein
MTERPAGGGALGPTADQEVTSSVSPAIPLSPPRGPKAHKDMARRLGIARSSAQELIVLTPDNDPFYKGTPAHVHDAEWFVGMLDRFGLHLGAHIRRVHYRMITSREPVTLPDGRPYLNIDTHWTRLIRASLAARILGLVDVESMVDRRNDPAIENAFAREVPLSAPVVGFPGGYWHIPELDVDALTEVELHIGSPYPIGYDYDPGDQPVLIELWVEKSTMADILKPLCRQLGINYLEGTGYESITQTVAFLRRAQRYGKAAHILYVSDFDPGGIGMPIGVARQVQFWLEELDINVDVSVDTTVLTHEQCVAYELPRMPIKESDLRKGNFEARYGEGATELDALEALHPGELEKVIRQAIEPYRDRELGYRLNLARRDAQQAIDDAWTEAAGAEVKKAAQELSEQATAVAAEQADRIRQFVEEALGQLDQFTEAARQLRQRADHIAAGLNIELPERPEPEFTGLADGRLLFDSRRHWLDQLAMFKQRQNSSGR